MFFVSYLKVDMYLKLLLVNMAGIDAFDNPK